MSWTKTTIAELVLHTLSSRKEASKCSGTYSAVAVAGRVVGARAIALLHVSHLVSSVRMSHATYSGVSISMVAVGVVSRALKDSQHGLRLSGVLPVSRQFIMARE